MLPALLFFCAVFIVGFEYLSYHGLGTLSYSQLLWALVSGLGATSILSFLLRVRSVKRAQGLVRIPALFEAFLGPLLLLALYVLIAANFFLHYGKAGVTSELPVLLTSMLLAQCIWNWKEWMRQQSKTSNFLFHVIVALVAALAVASMFQPDWSAKNQLYEYRGVVRWTGPVKDPNHFGLLMALGIVLATGLVLLRILGRIQDADVPLSPAPTNESTVRSKSKMATVLPGLLLYLSIGLLAFALMKSYSRGGWLSAAVGVGYLIWSAKKFVLTGGSKWRWDFAVRSTGSSKRWSGLSRILRENAISLLMISVSVLTLSYYCFRYTEVRVVRRVFSPGNVYDFSWRNRVVAYKGALQIIADNPWSGLGWGQQEVRYNEYYRPTRLTEGYAILLNDYLTLGMILGLPAVGCFIGYVWLGFKKPAGLRTIEPAGAEEREEDGNQWQEAWLQTTCRAGVVVLLIGFWFDHGLLMVPLGLPFWMLLEFGKEEPDLVKANLVRSKTTLELATNNRGWSDNQPVRMFEIFKHVKVWLLVLIVSVSLAALFWAKEQDPYQRIPFSLETAPGKKVAGMAVLPKFHAKYPVALYIYNTGGSLPGCGTQLRQIAEVGFAAIAIEYDQESQEEFNDQFSALHQFIKAQPWALTNVVWISSGAGAQRVLSYALSRRSPQPDLLAAIGGGSVSAIHESGASASTYSLRCPILLVHSEEDTLFSTNNCTQLASQLRSAGSSVEVCTLKGASHSPDLEHPYFLRALSEYCSGRLPPPDYAGGLIGASAVTPELNQFNRAFQRAGHHQNELWNALAKLEVARRRTAMTLITKTPDEALASMPPNELNQLLGYRQSWLRKYWTTGVLGIVSLLALWRCRDAMQKLVARFGVHAHSPWLRGAASTLAILALVVVAINLILPRLEFNQSRLTMARRFLPPIRLEDSLFLTQKAGAQHVSLRTILENIQLATFQRNHFYKNLDDRMFQQFILSPQIDSHPSEWNWRSELYINFQPRIRKEHDPVAAAKIVVEYLRERVGIDPSFGPGAKIETIWIQQMTNETGFQTIYVAALRSVGVAARLNDLKQAELWTGVKWQTAPLPDLFYIASTGN